MDCFAQSVGIDVTEEGMAAFAKAVKEGSHGGTVLLFSADDREGSDAYRALSALGMKVVRCEIGSEVREDHSLILDRLYPENCMAVAAIGGAAQMEAAKSVRVGRSVERVLYPTALSALSAAEERSFFGTKGGYLSLRSEGHRVIFDKKKLSASRDLRAGLGILLARLAEEADGVYERLIVEGGSPAAAIGTLRRRCEILGALKEEEGASGVVRVALALFRETPLPVSDSVHVGALIAAKQKKGWMGDYLFPCAYALLSLYEYYLSHMPLEHGAPSDRAAIAQRLGERCDWDVPSCLESAAPFAESFDDRDRVTKEYREDFAECLREGLALNKLSRLYRRAERGEEERLSPSDLLALFSLTGEAVSGYPLVKHIEVTGLTELSRTG